MKCLSLWQPWASLWLTRAKMHETRSWPTAYRGVLLIHAAQKHVALDGHVWAETERLLGPNWQKHAHYGAIIGAVQLIACGTTNVVTNPRSHDRLFGDWSLNRWAWQRASQVCILPTPVLWKGAQRIFNVNCESLEAHISKDSSWSTVQWEKQR